MTDDERADKIVQLIRLARVAAYREAARAMCSLCRDGENSTPKYENEARHYRYPGFEHRRKDGSGRYRRCKSSVLWMKIEKSEAKE